MFKTLDFNHIARFNSSDSASFLSFYTESKNADLVVASSKIPSKTFAPSSARCLRRSWFRLRGVEPDKLKTASLELQHRADMGTACHRIIQSDLKKFLNDRWLSAGDWLANPLCTSPLLSPDFQYSLSVSADGLETTIAVERPYPIHFACDGIMYWNNKYWLLEIKSVEPSTWNDLTDSKAEHIAQVNHYGTLLGLDSVLFMYVDRLHGSLKVYEYTIHPVQKEKVISDFQAVMDAVEYNIPPDPLPKGDRWCTSDMCPYYTKCNQWGR